MATEAKAVSTGIEARTSVEVSRVSRIVDVPTAKFTMAIESQVKKLSGKQEGEINLAAPTLKSFAEIIPAIDMIVTLAMSPFTRGLSGHETPEAIIKMAEEAVYEETGRNRFVEAARFKLKELAEDVKDEPSKAKEDRFRKAGKTIELFSERFAEIVERGRENILKAKDFHDLVDFAFDTQIEVYGLVAELNHARL